MSDLAQNPDFRELAQLIDERRSRAVQAVNHELVSLYWEVGKIVSVKIQSGNWGQKTVDELAAFLKREYPDLRGFGRRGLYRMRQFYETYPGEIVTPAVTQLPWTHNLLIMSQSKSPEEREFYLRACLKEKWTKRELERQLKGALFERVALSPAKLAPPLREIHPRAVESFRDSYLVEFLNLASPHSESDLHQGLLLCATKDDEVVEYTLSRTLSPTVVAEYQTKLPDKALLQAKLHEFLELETRESSD